ncbi:hypothetical protein [Brevundimonas subvibrioides]|uniref:Uncharacterized protein n=1 Tax=Brevundimonas subvibrioides (strain ATCC 15264 / DSM 4735 / LMG 14903 / NBRC 16000 / CB 81) TaxID=633149 RepID=D9QHZ3_BRESC|nr:hypothetical protein [Brevundimonas subvibrioides]ADL01251.1 conserved hypothetical protein [Brevundimonas subvibrioides ATCC 15264]
MSEASDPKSPKALQGSGAAFFAIGVTFLILGLTDGDRLAFVGVGAAFFAIGAAMFAKARKAGESDASRGEGDQ